ncbi:hypothetical protein D770_17680 [Flammeovirgaceae bacterium 311]|nr:hypothetical protein D770_17680 [Flammeovirgaceae bacterium 311]
MRVHLKLNFANPALFAVGFIVLFSLPYLYPSYHFPYLKVYSPFVHLLITAFIVSLILTANQLSKISLFHKKEIVVPDINHQFIILSKLVICISMIMNLLIVANAYSVYEGNIEAVKYSLEDFGGINIISQLYLFFVPPVIFYGIRNKASYKLIVGTLGVLLLVRSGLMAERLAFLEFVVPVFITYIIASKKRLLFTKMVKYFLLLLSFFMLLELTRQFYDQYIVTGAKVDVWFALTWTFERFFAYYADTTNKFYFSIENDLSFTTYHYLTPFVRILRRLTSINYEFVQVDYGPYRWRDFTNPGGLTMLYTDLGYLSIFVFIFFFAVFFKSYKSIYKGSLFALCLYPNLVTAILELPRFVNFYQTRFFVPLVFFIATYLIYKYLNSRFPIQRKDKLPLSRAESDML